MGTVTSRPGELTLEERAARLREEQRHALQSYSVDSRLAFLAEAGALLEASRDYQETVAFVARLALPWFADFCRVDLTDEDGVLRCLAIAHVVPGKEARVRELAYRQPIKGPLRVEVWQKGEPLLVPEIDEDLRRAIRRDEELSQILEAMDPRSAIIVPLLAGGQVRGVVSFAISESERRYNAGDLTFAVHLTSRASAAIENARLHQVERCAREAAELATERLRTLVDLIPQQVWICRADGQVEYFNQRMLDFLGVNREEADAIRDPAVMMSYVHPDDQERANATWAEAVANATLWEVELRHRRHDGVYRWQLDRAAPIRAADGTVVQWFGTATDIEAQKQAERETAELIQRESAFRERLMGIVGHDLRTPLAAITVAAGLLREGGTLAPGDLRVVDRMEASALRMARMVADLADFTRIRQGGLAIHRASFDLCLACRDAVDELATAHPDRRIEIEMRGDGWGEWDRDRLLQVVANLVTNAVDYGDPEAPIRVRVAGDAEAEVNVEVHNLGEPIAADDLPFLFDPFRRGRGSRERGSRHLGLGLYIVDEIVRAHGGRIEVGSTVEEGTRFSVRLPRHG